VIDLFEVVNSTDVVRNEYKNYVIYSIRKASIISHLSDKPNLILEILNLMYSLTLQYEDGYF